MAPPGDALSAGAAHPWGEFGVTSPCSAVTALSRCLRLPICLLVGLPEWICTRCLIFLEKNAIMNGTLASKLW